MPRSLQVIILACLLVCLTPFVSTNGIAPEPCAAQTIIPAPSPTPGQQSNPPQESIKVYTEEVLLPVMATDSNGRVDPSLAVNDLLILEDGVSQTVKSVRRIPASILFLLDTAGASNPAMKTNATRDLALRLVSQLRAGDRIAALQFGGRVEVIQSWTDEQEMVVHSLKTKLSSGRRTRLAEGLAAAAAQLKDSPAGNRHVVLITDGGELPADDPAFKEALAKLFSAQATVHVISYTLMGRRAIKRLHPKYPVRITSEKPKSANDLSDELTRPNDQATLESKLSGKIYLVIDTDFAMWKKSRDYAKSLEENEQWLAWLAEQSGGDMMLPNSMEELPHLTDELAREIDSQYVVTYRPKQEFTSENANTVRRVEVLSRRVGLHVRSRRSYVVATSQ